MASLHMEEVSPNRWQAEDEDFLEREEHYVSKKGLSVTPKTPSPVSRRARIRARQRNKGIPPKKDFGKHSPVLSTTPPAREASQPKQEHMATAAAQSIRPPLNPATSRKAKKESGHGSNTGHGSSISTGQPRKKKLPGQMNLGVTSSSSKQPVDDDDDDKSLTLVDLFGTEPFEGEKKSADVPRVKQEKWDEQSVMVFHQSTIGGPPTGSPYMKEVHFDDDDCSLKLEEVFPILGVKKKAAASRKAAAAEQQQAPPEPEPEPSKGGLVGLLSQKKKNMTPKAPAPVEEKKEPEPPVEKVEVKEPATASMEASVAVMRTNREATIADHNASLMSLTPEEIQERETRPWRKTSQLSSSRKLKGSSSRVLEEVDSSDEDELVASPKRGGYLPTTVKPQMIPDGKVVDMVDSGLTMEEEHRNSHKEQRQEGVTSELEENGHRSRRLEKKKSKRRKDRDRSRERSKRKKSHRHLPQDSSRLEDSGDVSETDSARRRRKEEERRNETDSQREERRRRKRERRERKKKKKKKRSRSESKRRLDDSEYIGTNRESLSPDEKKESIDDELRGEGRRQLPSQRKASSRRTTAKVEKSNVEKEPGHRSESMQKASMQLSTRDRLDFLKAAASGEDQDSDDEPLTEAAAAAQRSRVRLARAQSARGATSAAAALRTGSPPPVMEGQTRYNSSMSSPTRSMPSPAPSMSSVATPKMGNKRLQSSRMNSSRLRTTQAPDNRGESLMEKMQSVGQLDVIGHVDDAIDAKKKVGKNPAKSDVIQNAPVPAGTIQHAVEVDGSVAANQTVAAAAAEETTSPKASKKKSARGIFKSVLFAQRLRHPKKQQDGEKKKDGSHSSKKRFLSFGRRSKSAEPQRSAPMAEEQMNARLSSSNSEWAEEGLEQENDRIKHKAKAEKSKDRKKPARGNRRSASSSSIELSGEKKNKRAPGLSQAKKSGDSRAKPKMKPRRSASTGSVNSPG